MNPSLETFLGELYQLDSSLKEYEAELIPLIKKLMKYDPALSPDSSFVDMLRVQLRERSHSLPHSSMPFLQKFSYVFGGALMASVIALVIIFRPQAPLAPSSDGDSEAPLFPYMIQEEGKKAFGSLQTAQPATTANDASHERTQSGGGGANMVTPSAPPMGLGGGGMAVPASPPVGGGMDAKMIAPYPLTTFTYVYNGALNDLADSVSVFKRDPSLTRVNFAALADSLHLGSINLSSFKGMNIDSLSLNQNVPFGYQIYISLRDGTVGINQQWEQWPQSTCQTDACFQAERVKSGDVPSNDELITIARKFATDHGIDLSHYGDPTVDSSFGPILMRPMEDGERAPEDIPDTMRVIFPLLLEGKPTYDQSGMATGISIGVNLKYKRVSDVWGLSAQTYKKSAYTGVTDPSLIQKFIAQVDSYYGGEGVDVKNITVTLGDPTVGLVMYYRYANNMNEELLVPSLIFPVTNVDGDQPVYRKNVVVPLAQDLLNEQLNQPRPMPLDTTVSPPPNVKAE